MNSTIMDDLARQGINVNIKAVGIVTEVLVLLLLSGDGKSALSVAEP